MIFDIIIYLVILAVIFLFYFVLRIKLDVHTCMIIVMISVIICGVFLLVYRIFRDNTENFNPENIVHLTKHENTINTIKPVKQEHPVNQTYSFTPSPDTSNNNNQQEQEQINPERESNWIITDPNIKLRSYDYNQLPININYKTKDQDYGYSYIKPESWYPEPVRPPVCIQEKKCPVCPIINPETYLSTQDLFNSQKSF